ncbi:copper resistance CopC family protein [Pseudokineococcus basanitobsidens]|uniref:Copper resistance CopC family protein n=1 Tax=Pseudokineococcus basanitobsidens TaxID=1926649 RepID=A0ABU8RKG7_9ACTN
MTASPARPTVRRSARAWAVGALVLAVAALTAPAASAHDRLVGSDPEPGAVLDAVPAQVVLTFSSDVQELGTTLELLGSDGGAASDAETQVEGRDVVLPLPSDLAAGDYTLVYRVTSSDGHPVDGEVPFTLDVDAPATSAPAPAPAGSPTTASPTTAVPTQTAGPSPSASAGTAVADDADPAAATTEDGFPWVPVLVVVLVLALGGLAAGVLARRRGATR